MSASRAADEAATVSSFEANIAAISGTDRPCIDASASLARRSRTRSRAVCAIFTSRSLARIELPKEDLWVRLDMG
jgi:hypothetical protein